VFSNGILTLAAVSLALLVVTDAKVNKLVPFYAIGVFTGFAMAGFGMAAHHRRLRERRWRYKLVVNAAAGVMSTIVVLIFAVAKFTEGAWLVVVLFPVLVFVLIRLNREYRAEAEVLSALDIPRLAAQPNFPRHVVLVFVDDLDLASISALRYGKSLRPAEIRAVHFVIDERHARSLEQAWETTGQTIPLDLVDCPDRRLRRAAVELASRVTGESGTHATVLLPRRSYAALLGRLLHDRTADQIAAAISHVPNAAATIVPFDTSSRLSNPKATVAAAKASVPAAGRRLHVGGGDRSQFEPEPPAGCTPIGDVRERERITAQGRIRSVEVQPLTNASPVLSIELVDATGGITVLFYGRRRIRGIEPGRTMRVTGRAANHRGHLAIANPQYELVPS